MHHRAACRVLVHRTHTILRLAFGVFIQLCKWHCLVNYAAGAIVKRCNCISMLLCAVLRCHTTRMSDDVHCTPSALCACHREVECAFDMFETTRSFTHMSNRCVIRRLAFLNLGFVDLLSCTTPCHPPQPRIKEFWFVHEPQNREIALRKVGDFKMIVLPFGVWVIGVAPRRVWKKKNAEKKERSLFVCLLLLVKALFLFCWPVSFFREVHDCLQDFQSAIWRSGRWLNYFPYYFQRLYSSVTSWGESLSQ